MLRGREKTHTKGQCRNQYVARKLFREQSGNSTVLDRDRPNNLESHDKAFAAYPVGVEFSEGLEKTDDMREEKQD